MLIWALVLLYRSTHYSFRGGSSDIGTYCGAFYVYIRSTDSTAYWGIGAALSF